MWRALQKQVAFLVHERWQGLFFRLFRVPDPPDALGLVAESRVGGPFTLILRSLRSEALEGAQVVDHFLRHKVEGGLRAGLELLIKF